MNELNKISNDALLMELQERLDKGEIKIRGNQLMSKLEKDKNTYYAVRLDLNIIRLISEVIFELKEEARVLREDKEKLEHYLEDCKKQSETLKTGN